MANSKGPSSIRSTMYNGKNPLLPPKSPFPSISPSYSEFIPTIGPKNFQNPRDGNHQRTSSESFLIEEQPSWLDELLDEPDTPVRKGGHRRSSSDSFTYADLAGNVGSVGNYVAQDVNRYNKNMMTPASSWGPQDFDIYRDARERSFYADLNPLGKIKNKPWDAAPVAVPPPRGLPSHRGNTVIQNADRNPSLLAEKQRDFFKSVPQDPKASAEKNDSSHVKYSETDKRAKQQFAQRSRVRKLQYISELERSVQALQAEGNEVSAELEFTNQQIMILSMENKALKQRLESLAQEQLIKYLEHEVLERELGRLRNLYQQQQQQPIMPSSHRRSKSRDFLDQQFANLSLKPKEAATSSARENSHVSGQLHM